MIPLLFFIPRAACKKQAAFFKPDFYD